MSKNRQLQRGPRQPRHQELQTLAGSLGIVRSGTRKGDAAPVYSVTCIECRGYGGMTYRSGKDNDFTDALYRWVNHLRAVHRNVEAEGLRYRREAYEYAASAKQQAQNDDAWRDAVTRAMADDADRHPST